MTPKTFDEWWQATGYCYGRATAQEAWDARPVAFTDREQREVRMTIEQAATELRYYYDKYGMPGADGVEEPAGDLSWEARERAIRKANND